MNSSSFDKFFETGKFEVKSHIVDCEEHRKSGCAQLHDVAKNGDVETSQMKSNDTE